MSELDKHIERLVSGEDVTFDFPKNESSWDELFTFGLDRMLNIVNLKRNATQQSVHLTALRRGLALSLLFNVILLAVVLAIIGVR